MSINYKNLKNDIMREYQVLVVNNITEITQNEYEQLGNRGRNLQIYDLSTNLCESLKYYYGNYGLKSIVIILNNQAPTDSYDYSLWTTYNFYNAVVLGKSHQTFTFDEMERSTEK